MGALLIPAIVLILALTGVIFWLQSSNSNALKKLSEATARIAAGDETAEIPVSGNPEINKTSENITRIIAQNKIWKDLLDEKTRELERTTKSLDNFAYVVSHDLKAPFNSIKSIAELLRLEYADKFDESGKELLHFIDLKVEEMDKLLMGILLYSRVRQNEAAVEPVDLNEEVNTVIKEINPTEKVKIEIKSPLPTVQIERDLMHKLLFSLIDNSIKHQDKNKNLSLIEIGSQKEDGHNTIYVKDNGVGIDKKYYEKIFNIFYQVKDHDTDTEGSGVGLAIAKKIVEYKSGRIWVDSVPKMGSTFYFSLPEKGPSRN